MSLLRWESAVFVSDEVFHLAQAAADFGLVIDACVTGVTSVQAFIQLLAGVSLMAFHTLFLGPRTSLASDAAMFFGDMQFHFFHMLLCTWRLVHYLWTAKPRESRPFIAHWVAFIFHTAIVWFYSSGIQVSIRMQFVGAPQPPPPPRPPPPPPPPPLPLPPPQILPPPEEVLTGPSDVATEASAQAPGSPLPPVGIEQPSQESSTGISSLVPSAQLPAPVSKPSIAASTHLSSISSCGPLHRTSKDLSPFLSSHLSNEPPSNASDVTLGDISSQAPSVEPPIPVVHSSLVSLLVEELSEVPPGHLIGSSTGSSKKSPEKTAVKSAAGSPERRSDRLISLLPNQISKSIAEKSSRASCELSNTSFTVFQILGSDNALKPTLDATHSDTQLPPGATLSSIFPTEPLSYGLVDAPASLRSNPSTESTFGELLEWRPTKFTRHLNGSSSYSVDEAAL